MQKNYQMFSTKKIIQGIKIALNKLHKKLTELKTQKKMLKKWETTKIDCLI